MNTNNVNNLNPPDTITLNLEKENIKELRTFTNSLKDFIKKDISKQEVYRNFFQSDEANQYFRGNIFLPETMLPVMLQFMENHYNKEHLLQRFLEDTGTPETLKQYYIENQELINIVLGVELIPLPVGSV